MNQELICLASASPRRRQLLEQIGVAFEVSPADIDESPLADESPDQFVRRLAEAKAARALDTMTVGDRAIVLAADTIVVVDDEVYGKPEDDRHAASMLCQLSGRSHEVLTAVAMARDDVRACEVSRSRVTFGSLSSDQIDAYVATGEPRDKAGAYAVQGRAAIFIERIEGSFSGVMGLPLFETAGLLRNVGVEVMQKGAGVDHR